jgi:hypothetical protein
MSINWGVCVRSRLARLVPVVLSVFAFGVFSPPSSAARLVGGSASFGSFTVTGPVAGTIEVDAATCTAAKSTADVQFSWFGGVTSLKGINKQSIVTMELDISNTRYGTSGKFRSNDGSPPFLSFGSTQPSKDWQSVSGSFTTTKHGASGSVKAQLSPSLGSAKKLLSVVGHWQDCKISSS